MDIGERQWLTKPNILGLEGSSDQRSNMAYQESAYHRMSGLIS